MNLTYISITCACAVSLLSAAPGLASAGVDGFRSRLEKWVETRQIISEEESDWRVEQETLRAARDLLEQERDALKEEIGRLEGSNTQADEERRELLLRRAELQRANTSLEEKTRSMEQELIALAPRLPAPLQKRLELLLVQIPEDPENTKLQIGQRLMNILGVLAQSEKFNDTATFVGETRAVKGDQKVQVRTLYWGLGQAIYVDAQGSTAGIGRPGPDGWEFSEDTTLVDEARLLLDIYEGNVDVIEFVDLPVAIEAGGAY